MICCTSQQLSSGLCFQQKQGCQKMWSSVAEATKQWLRDTQSEQCSGTPPTYLSKKFTGRQYDPQLYRSICIAFLASQVRRKGNASIHLQFVLQYASYFYCGTPPICTSNSFAKVLGFNMITHSKRKHFLVEVAVGDGLGCSKCYARITSSSRAKVLGTGSRAAEDNGNEVGEE